MLKYVIFNKRVYIFVKQWVKTASYQWNSNTVLGITIKFTLWWKSSNFADSTTETMIKHVLIIEKTLLYKTNNKKVTA